MESGTYTLRLKAISSPENSTAGQLSSVTDTTARNTRGEVLTNTRGFPQSKRTFKFSKKEAEAQGKCLPLDCLNYHRSVSRRATSETVTTAATAAGGSFGA